MHTHDQLPDNIQDEKQASQPLYEFPPTPLEPSSPADDAPQAAQSAPSDEEIRQGLIYPPPPSFYQNMQTPAPPLSAGTPAQQAPASSTLPPIYAPPMAPQARPRRSYKWLWITAAILGSLLVISCGICGWAGFGLFSTSFRQASGTVSVAENYYSAIQRQDYSQAYSLLSPSGSIQGLTREQFIQQARDRDRDLGPVTSFTLRPATFSTDVNSDSSLSSVTFNVQISRTKQQYSTRLTVGEVNSHPKVTDFDHI